MPEQCMERNFKLYSASLLRKYDLCRFMYDERTHFQVPVPQVPPMRRIRQSARAMGLLGPSLLHHVGSHLSNQQSGGYITKRCRLSLLTNSTLVGVPMRGDGGGGGCGVSANAHHVTWSPNKLWRSTSIVNLCQQYSCIDNIRPRFLSCFRCYRRSKNLSQQEVNPIKMKVTGNNLFVSGAPCGYIKLVISNKQQ
jgi:hypothetical protein